MAGLYIRKIFVRVFPIDRIKKWKVQTKVGSVFVGGTLVAVAVAEYEGYISGIFAVYGYLKKWIDDIENENDIQDGRGNIVKDFMREKTKEMGRRNMIGNGVGQGLAWLHYAAYLHHVLPDIGNKVQQSEWYKGLSADQQRRLPMKLYEFIPRTCSIDIPGTDDSIQLETEITIDTNKKIKIPIYSIKDGKTMYYCMCKCPDELKTMNNVNDIQMAGISRSKYKLFQFPWNRVPTVQLFTVDTKLVQLMRFYYTLSSLLCLNNNGDRVRLLLLNESETKPSNVLLQAIKEEIQDTSSEKKLPSLFMKVKLTAEECKESIYDLEVFVSNPEDALIGKCGTLKHTEKNISLVTNGLDTNMNTSNDSCQKATEDPKVDILKQKTHRSLMENKLLSAEERKDVSYDFDVFVTHQNEVHDKEREHMKANYKDVERVNKALVARNMTILKEEDCRGQDWLTKLKYAATKCRWIVFLDKNETNNELFTSHKVTDSLKAILESRKVQSVAIVNTENESHVLDALRWITCLPYQKDIEYVVETLYKVVSGSEIKLKNSRDLYHKPGEYAVGLAWYYAANHLNRILPIMNQAVTKAMKEQNIPLPNIPKFFVFIPESFKTSEFLKDARPRPDQYTDYSPENKIPNRIAVYMLSKGQKQPKYYVGEYPTPLTMIRQIKEVGLLNEDETKLEVEKFYKTVNKIMAILLPKYRTDYEFVIFNDEQEELDDALIRIFQKEELRETAERIACTDCIINSLF